MHPTLTLGSIALPTGPLSALLAAWLAIELAARRARRFGLSYEDVLTGLIIALAAGIAAARIGHGVRFWTVYQTHLQDLFALRPSGLEPWPGAIAAAVALYVFAVRKRLDPVKTAAASMTGLVGGGIVYYFGSFLSGRIVGTVTEAPWATAYGSQMRHPTGLYLAVGCLLLWGFLWYLDAAPRKEFLLGLFGASLLLLFGEAFILYRGPSPILRWPQVAFMAAAACSAWGLSRVPSARPVQAAPRPASPDDSG